ncbi:hypothetical protein [Psychromonas ossibalaenae]|uniref:capsular polysaccharide export protein, LipB/KpsS family n=1 Tax=Psychromonas ossibalaenae TaxID=444922 RepID=UPI0003644944|nr:hypothetical protein [Psychromonas ossibalaenae]
MSIKSKITTLFSNPKGVVNKYVYNEKPAKKPIKKVVKKVVKKPVKKSVNNLSTCPLDIKISVSDGDYLYIPWIKTHGDKLVSSLSNNSDIVISPLWLNENIHNSNVRRSINKYSRECPAHFRRYIISALALNKNKIKAVILTMDWSTPMRLISSVCKELGIKTILIPHEGVFAKESEYYKDISTNVNVPISDYILCWGEQQKNIFSARGYPKERIKVSGSLKLDEYSSYSPVLTKELFCKIYSFCPSKKTILFSCQPLDSQYDVVLARKAQREIIEDLIEYVNINDVQLIIRKPPSNDRILNKKLDDLINVSDLISVDYATPYLTTPEESIAHCDVVLSINSTMLFEAILYSTPAISTKYVEFRQIWENINISSPTNKVDLYPDLNIALNNPQEHLDSIDLTWAKNSLSYGDFSGEAKSNIVDFLKSELPFDIYHPVNRFFAKTHNENIALNASLNNKLVESNKYLPKMLGVNSVISSASCANDIFVDFFINWGISQTNNKARQISKAKAYGKDLLIVEDGFIRSCKIGLSNEPGLSIILDNKTAYYDARKTSYLEEKLNSTEKLMDSDIFRAKENIKNIRENRVSKYNHAPDVALKIGKNNSKILLVDQRYGDMSVEAGLADEKSFENMLLDAINNYPEYDILIKRHPDATIGGKSSYYSDKKIGFTKDIDNVHLIDYDVNPYALFDIVDKVFCVTSGMGFEALLAGKEVHVYGVPFYSNWGLTIDKVDLPRRTRKRTLEETFFYSYINFSRYFNPEEMKGAEIEDVIAYIIKNR